MPFRITLFLLAVTLVAAPDDIVFKKRRIRGVIVKTENETVFVNPFLSRNPRMTWGVETFPQSSLKSVEPDSEPSGVYLRRLVELAPPGQAAPAEAEYELGLLAAEHGFDAVAREHWLRVLIANPVHAGATERLASMRLEAVKRADPRFNADLAARLASWFATDDSGERAKLLEGLRRETGFAPDLVYLERARRSGAIPKGRRDDVPLTLGAKTTTAVYTIYVPDGYDPMTPTPLVVGLHGGGPDGKDRQAVVGSGSSAMNFYQSGASRYGYIVVCPNAVRAPWRNPMNDAALMAVLEETLLSFNIDENRVYLTGHSMGGFGTWSFGPEHAHLWAAISPMSGGGSNGLKHLADTKTGIYLYHGADDAVVGCADSRRAAESLRQAEHDFVYTEIPDSGHGFPADVAEEMWSFFHARRLAVAPGRGEKGQFTVALEPLSSFERKVTKDEKLYLGAPGEESPRDVKSLIERLALGGGAAAQAADRLIELKDSAAVSRLGKVVGAKRAADDVRGAAARVLGSLGDQAATKSLTGALKSASLRLLPALADALGELGDAKAAKPLAKALGRVDAEFEDRLSGEKMAYSDWETCLAAYRALARALGGLGDASAVAPLVRVADRVLLGTWEVPKSERVNRDPVEPLGVCVATFVTALRRLGGDAATSSVDRLVERHGRLPGVTDAGR